MAGKEDIPPMGVRSKTKRAGIEGMGYTCWLTRERMRANNIKINVVVVVVVVVVVGVVAVVRQPPRRSCVWEKAEHKSSILASSNLRILDWNLQTLES